MPMKGKSLRVKVGTATGGPFNDVQDLNDASMSIDGDNQDISTFNSDYVKRLQGLKDANYSLSGFYKPDDTNGQAIIRAALINDTPLFVQFLPDGTTGFKQEVKVASFEVSGAADGVIEVSIDLEGSDAISLV
ncbi:phage tail tube protein [Ammoniphilus sp. YIM 78166]|uniref:phage tail tube protein n=1 Tax=Ammoniphilus sp. YIM 78166 TaxID=1644106 RepID=UPI00106FC83A|nr:phage tail tube protein [Ammoniphilus sp. YIM 78166]